jgi:general secretion pathway protein K
MALVLVVSSLTVSVAWLGYSAIARVENQRDSGQARYIAQTLMDYARWILGSDLRGAMGGSAVMDHLSEPWAQPIPHTKLQSLLSGQLSVDEMRQFGQAAISGQIHDEQAKFNLENLVQSGVMDETRAKALQAALVRSGVSSSTAQAVLKGVETLLAQTSLDGSGRRRLILAGEASVWQAFDGQVLSILGLEVQERARVHSLLTWLPERSALNVNTASREVLTLLMPSEAAGLAERIVAQRDRIPFRSLSELSAFLPPGQQLDMSQFDTKTKYFRAQGYAQFGRAEQAFEILLRRETGRVTIVDHKDLNRHEAS